ncbi:MAG: hypothetical protein ACXIU7_14350 [Roseinatronobacter sp.]
MRDRFGLPSVGQHDQGGLSASGVPGILLLVSASKQPRQCGLLAHRQQIEMPEDGV